ncbi:MAG: hypothetical protein MUO64_02050 [Anaerolineales bacterium]|nr:hypothetical protein [Anaerolineales bacterium]
MLNWTPEKFKKQLIAELAQNAEITGKYIEVEARRRLLAINDPKWGAKYRSQVVARLLTYEVETKPKEVIIKVGVRASGSGRHHGFFIEFGSRTSGPHPFLRPAVLENAAKIVALLSGK